MESKSNIDSAATENRGAPLEPRAGDGDVDDEFDAL